jgi:hypothetical protein
VRGWNSGRIRRPQQTSSLQKDVESSSHDSIEKRS